jgi:hypothetical protein
LNIYGIFDRKGNIFSIRSLCPLAGGAGLIAIAGASRIVDHEGIKPATSGIAMPVTMPPIVVLQLISTTVKGRFSWAT